MADHTSACDLPGVTSDGTRVCRICGTTNPIEDYRFKGGHRLLFCGVCYRKKSRETTRRSSDKTKYLHFLTERGKRCLKSETCFRRDLDRWSPETWRDVWAILPLEMSVQEALDAMESHPARGYSKVANITLNYARDIYRGEITTRLENMAVVFRENMEWFLPRLPMNAVSPALARNIQLDFTDWLKNEVQLVQDQRRVRDLMEAVQLDSSPLESRIRESRRSHHKKKKDVPQKETT